MPDDVSEVLYYRRRAIEEKGAADLAASPRTAELHHDLARLFEERAAQHDRRRAATTAAPSI